MCLLPLGGHLNSYEISIFAVSCGDTRGIRDGNTSLNGDPGGGGSQSPFVFWCIYPIACPVVSQHNMGAIKVPFSLVYATDTGMLCGLTGGIDRYENFVGIITSNSAFSPLPSFV